MGDRNGTEKLILADLKDLTKTDFNGKLYGFMFSKMNNKQFDEFMVKLRDGILNLQLVAPHEKGVVKVTFEDSMAFAKKLGYDAFQHITYKGRPGLPDTKSKFKYLVLMLPFRRTKQTIEKGTSVSADSKSTDVLTGQSVSDSRSSKISYSEIQVLSGMNLPEASGELMHDRGGDLGARTVIKNAIMKYGSVSDDLIRQYSTGVVSSATLKSYFNAMHYKINL